jgi:hypothetical protein
VRACICLRACMLSHMHGCYRKCLHVVVHACGRACMHVIAQLLRNGIKKSRVFVVVVVPLMSFCFASSHARIARGGHGLPKVSPGPTMLDPSTPCGRATSGMGWPACRAAFGLRPSSTLLDTPRRAPMSLRSFYLASSVPTMSRDVSTVGQSVNSKKINQIC